MRLPVYHRFSQLITTLLQFLLGILRSVSFTTVFTIGSATKRYDQYGIFGYFRIFAEYSTNCLFVVNCSVIMSDTSDPAPCGHNKRKLDPHSVCETCKRSRGVTLCDAVTRCGECVHLSPELFELFLESRAVNVKRNEKKNSPRKPVVLLEGEIADPPALKLSEHYVIKKKTKSVTSSSPSLSRKSVLATSEKSVRRTPPSRHCKVIPPVSGGAVKVSAADESTAESSITNLAALMQIDAKLLKDTMLSKGFHDAVYAPKDSTQPPSVKDWKKLRVDGPIDEQMRWADSPTDNMPADDELEEFDCEPEDSHVDRYFRDNPLVCPSMPDYAVSISILHITVKF